MTHMYLTSTSSLPTVHSPNYQNERHIHFNKKSFIGNLFSLAMESSSSSSSSSSKYSLSSWEYLALLFIRPILAIAFVISLISLGWWLAWKLVLVHVPLVQEIFGLRKKTVKPKPSTRGRLSKIYNSMNARNSSAS
ncbi:hypothetical protein RGQ29_008708 [Quercus rubra]|uniref:Transmembrane protein n=1 Tax=Quercus rubra TaxID=3512 RepID=A0AAN7E0Z3_QUERU|nr:hypothetical protein RGQ29_008708 [Quercus rubra]